MYCSDLSFLSDMRAYALQNVTASKGKKRKSGDTIDAPIDLDDAESSKGTETVSLIIFLSPLK